MLIYEINFVETFYLFMMIHAERIHLALSGPV